MNSADQILQVRRLPGRVNAEQAAALIGVPTAGIPLLIAAKLLKPLGTPAQNSSKVFASIALEEHCRDPHWLDRVTRCVEKFHREKNKAASHRNRPSSEAFAAAA